MVSKIGSKCLTNIVLQLAVEYASNALIVKVDTDDEYEFARDMQVFRLSLLFLSLYL